MIREIVLDTETTGFSPNEGDKMVEIGCVELINHIPTGQHYHTYLNPLRDMPEGAFRVHGLSTEFLSDKPVFGDIVEQFLQFIADSTLIIHNAPFDMGFLNAELQDIKLANLANEVIDTVQLARKKHPGARVGLDALCRHYSIDNSHRTLHGALLDSEILAEVYLELLGGRQSVLLLGDEEATNPKSKTINVGETGPNTSIKSARQRPLPLKISPTSKDMKDHKILLETLEKLPIWSKYQ